MPTTVVRWMPKRPARSRTELPLAIPVHQRRRLVLSEATLDLELADGTLSRDLGALGGLDAVFRDEREQVLWVLKLSRKVHHAPNVCTDFRGQNRPAARATLSLNTNFELIHGPTA
jgi:hypothetical protein